MNDSVFLLSVFSLCVTSKGQTRTAGTRNLELALFVQIFRYQMVQGYHNNDTQRVAGKERNLPDNDFVPFL